MPCGPSSPFVLQEASGYNRIEYTLVVLLHHRGGERWMHWGRIGLAQTGKRQGSGRATLGIRYLLSAVAVGFLCAPAAGPRSPVGFDFHEASIPIRMI